MDRIDIHINVPRVQYEKSSSSRLGESSAVIRERVIGARRQRSERFRGTHLTTNADTTAAEIRVHCQLDAAGQSLMIAAMRQLQLCARGRRNNRASSTAIISCRATYAICGYIRS